MGKLVTEMMQKFQTVYGMVNKHYPGTRYLKVQEQLQIAGKLPMQLMACNSWE
jgi:hypothetical protein